MGGRKAAKGGGSGSQPWPQEFADEVLSLVAQLQKVLRLTDWEITVDLGTRCGEDAYAQVHPHPYQKRAEIQFGPRFAELSSEQMRQTLIHELIHCHLFHLDQLIADQFECVVGKKRAKLALVGVTAAIEQATDALADVLAPLTAGVVASPNWPVFEVRPLVRLVAAGSDESGDSADGGSDGDDEVEEDPFEMPAPQPVQMPAVQMPAVPVVVQASVTPVPVVAVRPSLPDWWPFESDDAAVQLPGVR